MEKIKPISSEEIQKLLHGTNKGFIKKTQKIVGTLKIGNNKEFNIDGNLIGVEGYPFVVQSISHNATNVAKGVLLTALGPKRGYLVNCWAHLGFGKTLEEAEFNAKYNYYKEDRVSVLLSRLIGDYICECKKIKPDRVEKLLGIMGVPECEFEWAMEEKKLKGKLLLNILEVITLCKQINISMSDRITNILVEECIKQIEYTLERKNDK